MTPSMRSPKVVTLRSMMYTMWCDYVHYSRATCDTLHFFPVTHLPLIIISLQSQLQCNMQYPLFTSSSIEKFLRHLPSSKDHSPFVWFSGHALRSFLTLPFHEMMKHVIIFSTAFQCSQQCWIDWHMMGSAAAWFCWTDTHTVNLPHEDICYYQSQ